HPLGDRGKLVAAEPRRVETLEGTRVRRRGDDDARGMAAAELEDPPCVPGRHEVERVLGGVLDPGPLDPRVEVGHVDELRALPVGTRCQLAHDLLQADVGRDRDDLPRLHVRADPDRQVGEPFCECRGRQAAWTAESCQTPSRSSGTRSPSLVRPVTSTSLLPIMKSMWTALWFTRARSSSVSTANAKPDPSAMWLAAFSSRSVS